MRQIKMKALRKFNRIAEGQEFNANKSESRLFTKLGFAEIISSDEVIIEEPAKVAEITREYAVTETRQRGRPRRLMPED